MGKARLRANAPKLEDQIVLWAFYALAADLCEIIALNEARFANAKPYG